MRGSARLDKQIVTFLLQGVFSVAPSGSSLKIGTLRPQDPNRADSRHQIVHAHVVERHDVASQDARRSSCVRS